MLYCLMSDLGNLSIEDALKLTFRQVACLWERYLNKQQWNIKMQIDLNPFLTRSKKGRGRTSSSEGSSGTVTTTDATTAEGIAELQAKGIPIKIRKPKARPQEAATQEVKP